MWINQKNAVLGEMQESVQDLQISFRSGKIAYLISIPKSWGFSQSLLGVPAGGDIVWQKPIISRVVIN